MKTMKQILTAAVCAVSAALGLAVFATEATLLTADGYNSDASKQTSGLTRAESWSISANFPDSDIDYRNADKMLRTPPTGASYVFGGNSLIVGSIAAGTDGDYSVCSRSVDQEVTFQNDGLKLERGKLANQNPRCGIFKGKVTLLNTAVDGFYLQGHQTMSSYAHMDFQCPFIGAAGTKLAVVSRPAYNTGGSATTTKYVFSGDLSGFEGTMTVVPIKNSKDVWFGTNVIVGVKVASCPGSMDFYQETTLSLDDPAVDFSLATLRLRKGSSLSFAADPTTGKPACLTVTAYTQDDVVALDFPDFPSAILTDTTTDHCFSLVKVPDTTPLDEKRFTLHDSILLNVCPYWRLRVDTEGGFNVLKLYANGTKTVTLDADAGYNNEGFPGDSKGKGSWSDGGPVASGNEYYNVGHKLRPDPTPNQIQPFEGDSLTIANGAEFHLKAWGVHLNLPRILSETGNNVGIYQYGANPGGGDGWEQYAARSFGGTPRNCNIALMTGDPLFVHTASGKSIEFKMSSHRGIVVKNELVGNAFLALIYFQEGASDTATTADGATLVLDNINTNFTGTIRLYGDGMSSKPNRLMPSYDRCSTLYLTDPRNLGGPLPAFNFEALRMENYARLSPTNSMTLDDPTRGIYLAMGTPSQFEVKEGIIFAVREQIRYNGILYKTGAGTLALGSGYSPKFGYQGYDDPTTSGVGAHGLTIAEGTFKPLDDLATDGLEVVFTNGTAIALDASASTASGVGRYGMRLVKNGSSLSVPEGTVTVAVANESGTDVRPADGQLLPICTVASAATAESCKAFFTVPRTEIHFGKRVYAPGELSVRDNNDGTFTLGVTLRYLPEGMVLLFK